MPVVNLVGTARQDAGTKQASTGRLVNYYRDLQGERFVLRCVPGTTQFADTGMVIGRAIEEVGGKVYAVSGGRLFTIGIAGSTNNLGAVTDDAATTIAGYDNVAMIAAGGNYYTYNGTTLAQPGSGAFTSVGSVCFVRGYGVLTQNNGDKFEWTTLRDPTTRVASQVARAENRDDVLRQGVELGGNLYLFGRRSFEVWTVTGQSGTAAFAPLVGMGKSRGLLARGLVANIGEALAFVGDDGVVYTLYGGDYQQISPSAVNRAISAETPTNLFYSEYEGHRFLVVRFTNRPAWVFDFATGEWHERQEGQGGAWGVIASIKAFSKTLYLKRDGKVYQAGGVTDAGSIIYRTATSETFEQDGRRFSVDMVGARAAHGLQSGQADIQLRISRDRGMTWTEPKVRNWGSQGEYRERAVWRRQGQTRALTLEFTQADTLDVPFFGEIELGITG